MFYSKLIQIGDYLQNFSHWYKVTKQYNNVGDSWQWLTASLCTWVIEVNVCGWDTLNISGNPFPLLGDSNLKCSSLHWAVAKYVRHLFSLLSHLSTSLTHSMFENCSNSQCICEVKVTSTSIWTGQVSCEQFSEEYKVVNLFVEINWHLLLMSSTLIKMMFNWWKDYLFNGSNEVHYLK